MAGLTAGLTSFGQVKTLGKELHALEEVVEAPVQLPSCPTAVIRCLIILLVFEYDFVPLRASPGE